ncbi:MAG: cupin domain-containing protein [candidate division WOR-3 bacterium]|nr:cupin domain-containing protein [candidate division WOR-3 bacterium]MDH5682866.1 cupin domain-containing protein [candidate division WOR-3 bacterium]
MEKIDFTALAEKIKKSWTPIEIIRLEGFHLLLSLFEGTYRFHKHDAEELFFVLKGTVQVESKEKTITLKAGEGLVLPKGLVHRSMAKESALVIMFERTNLKTVFVS